VTVFLEPGAYVRHPDRPDWGIGQVQTVVRQRVTVNFENAGKQLINTAVITLVVLDDDLK
jgi:transcription elongation factor GreA-like protein